MKVILLQNVPKVGRRYDSVEVSKGYALNFLIPKGFARTSDASFEKRLGTLREQEAALRQTAESGLIRSLEAKQPIEIMHTAKMNEQGHLFATIKRDEIAREISDAIGVELDPDYLMGEGGIKDAGEHMLTINVGGQEFPVTYTVVAE